MKVCIDAGHGLGNRKPGRYDTGAVVEGIHEADIALTYANTLREILLARKIEVVRTRKDKNDPCSVSDRAKVAKLYGCQLLISFHCNEADGVAGGTETFYRGEENRAFAELLNKAVWSSLITKRNRGAKHENESQHRTLAVMAFQPAFLIELGFLDNAKDRAAILNSDLMRLACLRIADAIVSKFGK